jgi:hypothetical protein
MMAEQHEPTDRASETEFEIAVRQIWEREEVGRVTWQLERKQIAKGNEV